LVVGKKHWLIYPPQQKQDFFSSPACSGCVSTRKKIRKEFLQNTLPTLSPKPMECYQNAGDVLYVPHMYHHAVFNLGEMTVAVSVIHDGIGYAKEFEQYRTSEDL